MSSPGLAHSVLFNCPWSFVIWHCSSITYWHFQWLGGLCFVQISRSPWTTNAHTCAETAEEDFGILKSDGPKAYCNKPLAIPAMAHPTFTESVQRFLRDRDHIWNHIDLAIPLHLPTHKIREAASPTLGSAQLSQNGNIVWFLSSWFCSMFLLWYLEKASTKSTAAFSALWVRCYCSSSGAVSISARIANFPKCEFQIDIFSLADWCFQEFWGTAPSVDQASWASSLFCGTCISVLKHWTLHCQEIQQRTRLMHSDLARLKRWLPRKVVLHHADHEIHRNHCFLS